MADYEDFKTWADDRSGGSIWAIKDEFGVSLRTAVSWLHRYLTDLGAKLQPLPESEAEWQDFERMWDSSNAAKRSAAPYN